MEIDDPIRRVTWLDHYTVWIPFSHFMLFSAIVFLCIVVAVFKSPRVYFRLIVPASALPLVIGILGSAFGLQMSLVYNIGNINSEGPPLPESIADGLHPLVVGSSLSGVFILITLFVLFVVRHSINDSPSK